MQLCDGKKYTTYILELIRNNGITNVDKEKSNEKVPSSFLMFDYFDVLYCKELCGEEKKYLNYLSIENVFEDTAQDNASEDSTKRTRDYKVSYKTLSLFCKAKTDEVSCDLFSVMNAGGYLSGTPFLGLIQISLCKENYIGKNVEEVDIDAFLENCENRILEIAEKYKTIDTKMKLFRSSTTGDFCLVLRTDSIEAIYNIAIALNATQNDSRESVKMLTFTNVGIECRYQQGIGYATLDKGLVSTHPEIKLALRFSANDSLRKALQGYLASKGKGEIKAIKGLFGRYEYLLHIGLDEFSDIYPFLCEQKFGRKVIKTGNSVLEDIFRKSYVKNINERILVGLETDIVEEERNSTALVYEENDNRELNDRTEQQEVLDKNDKLSERIKALGDRKVTFQEEHFAFQDLIRGMKEIYKAFSSSGMDKESYINWRIFHKDMDILCECIEQMLNHYQNWAQSEHIDREVQKRQRTSILIDWRNNLQAINRYTTLVQNVNYQTYQAPIYEIQTQIDTEKAMVAYREAMELYITDAISRLSGEDDTEQVYPIIYPDLSKDTVEITAPFKVKKPDGIMPKRAIVCTVPSFEYFGRMYDLLPWILHETSHHLRVSERMCRNSFVAGYVLSYVFQVIMREPLSRLANCVFYEEFGIMEKYLAASMAEVAKKEICALEDFDKINFERLILELDKWFVQMFPSGIGYQRKTRVVKEEDLKRQIFDFCLDAFRKEEILDNRFLDMILKIRKEDDLAAREELARALLDKYYINLCGELKDQYTDEKIDLVDLYNYERLNEKLMYYAGAPDEVRAAARDYCYKVIAVYRIVRISLEGREKKVNVEQTEDYLKKVFEHFKQNYGEKIKQEYIRTDVPVMHIMRSLGLMNDDVELFQTKMSEIMCEIDNSIIMQHKEIKLRTYLESYADMLMATSLQLNSFGYCRQVLQTVSDARLIDREYEYEHVNYERWRTIAAVLLAKEGIQPQFEGEGQVKLHAKSLVKSGKEYCKYTLRCILEKLLKKDGIKDNLDNQRKLKKFLWRMNRQIANCLDGIVSESEENLFLSILLRGEEQIHGKEVEEEWKKYKRVAEVCGECKYNFWRIDCFCRGIGNIVQDGYITVSKDLFEHMESVRAKADTQSAQGCFWERNRDFLIDPKRDVGEFYNSPEQVHEKTPAQKLENTIEFIQNYYYFNRIRVMNE